MTKTYILGQGYVEHNLVPWKEVQTLQEFYDRMKAYDWTTSMSDDHRVYVRLLFSFEPSVCLEQPLRSDDEVHRIAVERCTIALPPIPLSHTPDSTRPGLNGTVGVES